MLNSFRHVVEKQVPEVINGWPGAWNFSDVVGLAYVCDVGVDDEHHKRRYRFLSRYMHVWAIILHVLFGCGHYGGLARPGLQNDCQIYARSGQSSLRVEAGLGGRTISQGLGKGPFGRLGGAERQLFLWPVLRPQRVITLQSSDTASLAGRLGLVTFDAASAAAKIVRTRRGGTNRSDSGRWIPRTGTCSSLCGPSASSVSVAAMQCQGRRWENEQACSTGG